MPVQLTHTVTDVARICKVSPKTVVRWIRNRELVASKLGHQWRITSDNLDKFVRANSNV